MRIARGLAVLGGFASLGLGLLVVTSITLRSPVFRLGGVPGDFELVQMLTAISVFCFLPLCQARGGHVIVDAASRGWGEGLRRRVDGLWELVAAVAMGLIAVQSAFGAASLAASNTRSMVLALPTAPVVAICALLAAVLAVIAAVRGLRGLLNKPVALE